jgi:endonuclease YncB( thermonuclease family)
MRIGTIATAAVLAAITPQPACAQAQIDETAAIEAATGPAVIAADRSSLIVFTVKGTVRSIEDGDTLALEAATGARFKIRFSDIDTPEVSHPAVTPRDCQCKTIPYRPGQPGGQSGKASLRSLVSEGEEVTAECYELDIYGRSVCHVFKGGTNLNLEQIKRGWGWLPSTVKWVRDPQSRPAEEAARLGKAGAWGLPGQVSPAE